MMEFLKRVQNLPLKQRKAILWVIIVILAVAFCILWLKITKERIEGFRKEEIIEGLNLPGFDREFLEIPELRNEEQ